MKTINLNSKFADYKSFLTTYLRIRKLHFDILDVILQGLFLASYRWYNGNDSSAANGIYLRI